MTKKELQILKNKSDAAANAAKTAFDANDYDDYVVAFRVYKAAELAYEEAKEQMVK